MDKEIIHFDECIRLGEELLECMRCERRALISMNVDELISLNFRKEELLNSLVREKKQWRVLKGSLDQGIFREREKRWGILWRDIKALCELNHQFMRHSLKNMAHLAEHLKQTFKNPSLYTHRGVKQDGSPMGQVVELSY